MIHAIIGVMKQDINYRKSRTCIDCGTLVTDHATCCHACAAKRRMAKLHPPLLLTCSFCGKEYRSKQSQKDRKFCSMECRNEASKVSCAQCGKRFTPDHGNRRENHTCSIRCRGAYQKAHPNPDREKPTLVTVSCHHCGQTVTKYRSQIANHKNTYCSLQCARFGRHEHPKGWISRAGYRFIMVNGKEIEEHRHVMELYIGRPLEKDEVVHHINEDPLDNRLENLALMTKSQHTILHNTGKDRSRRNKDNFTQ